MNLTNSNAIHLTPEARARLILRRARRALLLRYAAALFFAMLFAMAGYIVWCGLVQLLVLAGR